MLSRPYIIYWAALVQVLWGVSLIADSGIAKIAILGGASFFVDSLGLGADTVGALLILVALIACIGLYKGDKDPRKALWMAFLIPQYIFMVIALVVNTQVLINQEYHGRHYEFPLLVALLGPLIIAGVLHTLAILERYRSWRALQYQ